MKQKFVKICGIMNAIEAEILVTRKVDFVGLNFIPTSNHVIDLDTAMQIVSKIKKSPIKVGLLFKNQKLSAVLSVLELLNPDFVQLNGDESVEYAHSLNYPIMRAIHVSPNHNVEAILEYIKDYPASYIILDRLNQGNGPRIAEDLASAIVNRQPKPVFLAGGLNSSNVGQIVQSVQPYGIDIASGVRTANALDVKKLDALLTVVTSIKLPNH